jgi:hypothetical protein
VTLPAFRHEVHTVIRRRVPGATSARTVCTFGFQRRGVRRWEWDTLLPKPGDLPQMSQTLATVSSSGSFGRCRQTRLGAWRGADRAV